MISSDTAGWLMLILLFGTPVFLFSLALAAFFGWLMRRFPSRPPDDRDYHDHSI